MATSMIKKDIQKTTLTGGYINTSWSLTKIGDFVFWDIINLKSAPAGSFNLGVTIPAAFRPARNMSYTVPVRGGAVSPAFAMGVNADGSVMVYNYGSAQGVTNINNTLVWSVV